MRRLHGLGAVAVLSIALTGCSGSPAPEPSGSSTAVDNTLQASINGEWTVTRTVVSSDDAANPVHAVAAVSARAVQFVDVECFDGPCSGSVQSGPTNAVRETTTFTSSGDVIRYEFTGFLNCLRQDTGAVLVVNGYSYTSTVEVKVIANDATDDTKASTLEGTMTYTDTLTPEAIEAGCTRTPLETTTEYTLTAVRAVAVVAPAAITAPSSPGPALDPDADDGGDR